MHWTQEQLDSHFKALSRHEAAHAIVGDAIGLHVRSISIRADLLSFGRTSFVEESASSEQLLKIGLAGLAAEYLNLAVEDRFSFQDFLKVEAKESKNNRDSDLNKVMTHLFKIGLKSGWDSTEAEAHFTQYADEVLDIVRQFSVQIELLSNLLMEKGNVDGKEFGRAVNRAERYP